MKIKTFEELKAWKDAREFVKIIYELTSSNCFNKDYGLSQRDGNAKRSDSKSIGFNNEQYSRRI